MNATSLRRLSLLCYDSVIVARVLKDVDGSEVDESATLGAVEGACRVVEILTGRYVHMINIWLGD